MSKDYKQSGRSWRASPARQTPQRIAITGFGAVIPLGIDARILAERWRAGLSGIKGDEGGASEFEPTDHPAVKRPLHGSLRGVRPWPATRRPRRPG